MHSHILCAPPHPLAGVFTVLQRNEICGSSTSRGTNAAGRLSQARGLQKRLLPTCAVPDTLAGSALGGTEARTSLIPETLEEMRADVEQQGLSQRLAKEGQAVLTREERRKRQRSLDRLEVPPFAQLCRDRGSAPLKREPAAVFQVNIGLLCNQACSHCHVESSPLRTEAMDRRTVQRCLDLLAGARDTVRTLDVTGGAPELNVEFRYLVAEARAMGFEVIDRCNLTVLLEPGQEDLVDFLARHQVRVVASMPCYSAANVDAQRGRGVFDRSIRGLQLLNEAGYGRPGTGLVLDLVYNPGGPFLAPPQAKLQAAYKEELASAYGITFNSLLCLNNMPIKRYVDYLQREKGLEAYMELLVNSFNVAAADGVMCRDTVSVGWDGRLYDCDFNQQLEIGIRQAASLGGARCSIWDIDSLDQLTGLPIATDNHCFGCTAGSGSSCQGAVA